MAKKQTETPSLLETFRDFNQTKNIDDTTLLGVLEESFRSVIAKIFGTDENFTVVVNPDKGDFEITRSREIVADDEVEDPNKQIALSEARRIEPDFEVGEDCSEHIEFEDFGRRAILTLRQTLASKILELEHDSIYNKYKDREGDLITAEVYQTWKNETLLVDEEKNDLLLPKTQQIPRDENLSFAHQPPLPSSTPRTRNPRNRRRHHSTPCRGPHPGRTRQNRRRKLRPQH